MKTTARALRKGVIIGALCGGLLTILIQRLVMAIGRGGGEELFSVFIWAPILAPTWALYQLAGWKWNVGSVYEVPTSTFYLMILINSIICAILGCLLGYFLHRRALKKANREN